ncbi:hypothetical protein [aff. Roholtiella sp. LEGE 12411]|uniref:hypothetical protein n=1 Tax=aff. Roholtiella sp. LEGE 12411 TaxID=1828822 RepID=UPI0018830C6A|nr:hypothetical protein [aff. Roholtiella sp. LEGE 12411]
MKKLRTPLTPFFPVPYYLFSIRCLYESVHESNGITIYINYKLQITNSEFRMELFHGSRLGVL